MVYAAHGQRDRLICTNAREYHDCWMSCSVDGPKARTKLVAAISAELRSLPGFDDAFMASVERQMGEVDESRQKSRLTAEAQIATLERNLGNITAAIAKAGHSEALLSELRRWEADLAEQRLIRENAGRQRTLPALPSRDELLAARSTTLEAVLAGDEPAIRLVKQLVPRIEVFPVRLRGGGIPVLRAKVTIDLTAAMPSLVDCLATLPELQREVVVDLFDPPQREAHRVEAMKLHAAGTATKEIAASLGITTTAVHNIHKLQRALDESGSIDPDEVLNEPPADYTKLRRHLHPRFLKPATAAQQEQPMSLDETPVATV